MLSVYFVTSVHYCLSHLLVFRLKYAPLLFSGHAADRHVVQKSNNLLRRSARVCHLHYETATKSAGVFHFIPLKHSAEASID